MKNNYIIVLLILFIGVTAHAQFGPQQIITDNAITPKFAIASDLDGDGDRDVVMSGWEGLAWYKNIDGLGTFSDKIIITEDLFNPRAIFATDIDGDGDMDLLGTSFDAIGLITWHENLDGQGTFGDTNLITNQASGAKDVHGADLDGDGDIDVLSASRGDNKVAWYENIDGQGTFSDQIIITDTADTVDTVSAADIDGDGDMDVIYGAAGLDNIAWFENTNGQGDFVVEHLVSNDVNGVESIFIVDVDNDGDKDIISATFGDNTLDWFENLDGLGTYGPKQNIDTDLSSPLFVFTADLDNDNDADILAALAGDNSIVWYENLGSSTFGEQQLISDQTEGARTVFAADLDGDGYKDVLSASIIDYKIAWYKNITYLGLEDKESQSVSLYPNPVETILYIKTENNLTVNFIEVYDVLGSLVIQEKNTVDKVDLSLLNGGMYFIKLDTENGNTIKIIIKE